MAAFHIDFNIRGLSHMCGCMMGLLPIQHSEGSVWLSQNIPIILLSCFSAMIDSYCTDRLLPLLRGDGSSQTELLTGRIWGQW